MVSADRGGQGRMTSEIAVMSQRCIALAADSAVTLTDGKKVIVRNDQRKLFDPAPGLPLGVMFFGVADIMGHPWDVLIQHFRKKGWTGAQPHMRDYAAKFTGMLDGLVEFFPPDHEKDEYTRLVASVFRFVLQLAQFLRDNQTAGQPKLTNEEIVRQAVGFVWKSYQFLEDGKPRSDLTCFPAGFGEKVARRYADVVEELIKQGFSSFALDDATRQKLHDIAAFCVAKDLFLEDVTGLVFAGYGSAERYPAVVTYNVSAVLGGIVKRAEVGVEAIDSEMRSGITLFADCEATFAFLRGIELDLEMRLYGTVQEFNQDLVNQVLNAVGSLDPAHRESIRRQAQADFLPQYLNRFHGRLSEYQQRAYLDPVLHVLEIATRQDMAETAEQLVALNIFKKRIMAKQQTVGGAVDVAVISREDGFQWVKKQGAAS